MGRSEGRTRASRRRILAGAFTVFTLCAFGGCDDQNGPPADAANAAGDAGDAADASAAASEDGAAAADSPAAWDEPAALDAGAPPIGEGLFAMLAGEAKTYAYTLTNTAIVGGRSFSAAAVANSPYTLTVQVTKDEPGTYDCKTAPLGSVSAIIPDAENRPVSWASSAIWGGCSITVATVARAAGERWTGTFTATLLKVGGSETLAVKNGYYSFTRAP